MWFIKHTLFMEKRDSHSSQGALVWPLIWKGEFIKKKREKTANPISQKPSLNNTTFPTAYIQTLTDPACHVCQETLAAFKIQKVWLSATWTQGAESARMPTCTCGLKTPSQCICLSCVFRKYDSTHTKCLFWTCSLCPSCQMKGI